MYKRQEFTRVSRNLNRESRMKMMPSTRIAVRAIFQGSVMPISWSCEMCIRDSYYRELIEYAHQLGMHFWLHACGNIEMMIPDLIEIGLDVPVSYTHLDVYKRQQLGKMGYME